MNAFCALTLHFNMKRTLLRYGFFRRLLYWIYVIAGLFVSSSGFAQDEPDDQDIIELSPFVVDVSGDRGYIATNQISGTRVNALIKDTPVALEVLTSELLEDRGAT